MKNSVNLYKLTWIIITSLFTCDLQAHFPFTPEQPIELSKDKSLITSQRKSQDIFYTFKHLAQYSQLYPQEKVWLHFDNTAYYQGDTIWFKAYVRSTNPQNPQPISKVLYVDLLTPSGRILHSRKCQIIDGQCNGEFPLMQVSPNINDSTPQDVARQLLREAYAVPGFYEIRAYTRHMLNWDYDVLFSRVFPVYDAPAFPGDYTNHMTPSEEILPASRPQIKKGKNIQIAFYPEGGHAVIGIPCQMAFKVTDEYGNSLAAEGELLFPDGHTLSIHTLHDGMGVFNYTPLSPTEQPIKLRLKATSNKKDISKTFELPPAEEQGYVMNIDNRRPGRIQIMITSSSGLSSHTLGISATHEGNLYYADTLNMVGGDTRIRMINTAKLPTGVVQFTLFDEYGPIADRQVFVHPEKVKPLSTQIELTASNLTQDKISTIHISTNDQSGNAKSCNLSLTVRDATPSYAPLFDEDPRIELLLASDLRGYIHNPAYYFQRNDIEHRKALDLLMMVQGWRRYEWEIASGYKKRLYPHYCEEGLILNGYLYNKRGRKPICGENVHITMYNPDRSLVRRGQCPTDSIGNFNFLFQEYYGRWTMTLNTDNNKRKREVQYRIDRNIQLSPRSYEAAETVIPASPSSGISGYNNSDGERTSIHRENSLDKVQVLAEVEVANRKKRPEGIHLILDVEKEHNHLADLGRAASDVETFLDEMEVGFHAELDIKTLAEQEDSSTIPDELRTICYFNGDMARVVCLNPHETSLGSIRHIVESENWAIEIPIEEVEKIEVYDPRFLRQKYSSNEYLTDSLVATFLPYEDRLNPIKIDSLREQLRIVRTAMIYVTAKPKAQQIRVPKYSRNTFFDGYSSPLRFTADYIHMTPPKEDFRRTLLWIPNLQTDSEGKASVNFRPNSRQQSISISTAGWGDEDYKNMNYKNIILKLTK